MRFVLNTAPDVEPVTLPEVKTHLRVTASDEDAYLLSLIQVARRSLEVLTGRAFIQRTVYGYLDTFPEGRVIEIPLAPVSAITSVSYVASDETTATYTLLSTAYYTGDVISQPPRIIRTYGVSWPSTWKEGNAVQILFTAGYGLGAPSVPADLRHAMLMLVGHWYTVRQPLLTSPGGTMEVPKGIEYLALPHKLW